VNPRLIRPRAFSLVELLTVIAIISILATLSITAFNQISRASKLAAAGQSLVDNLNLARQTAMTKNRRVEVRIYQIPSSPASSGTACRAIRLFVVQSAGDLLPLTKLIRFQDPVVLSDSGMTLPNSASTTSTILAPTGISTNATTDATNDAAKWPVPGAATYQYISFNFLPDGGTDLDPGKSWLATLMLANDPLIANSLPANYLTVRIDPVLGKITVFRP
jgi:uncharacterized protein (TIGR02596 family)